MTITAMLHGMHDTHSYADLQHAIVQTLQLWNGGLDMVLELKCLHGMDSALIVTHHECPIEPTMLQSGWSSNAVKTGLHSAGSNDQLQVLKWWSAYCPSTM